MTGKKCDNSTGPMPQIHYLDTVPTTMEVAVNMAKEGKLDIWDSVVAQEQTAGRGQMRRHWHSLPGNLYASIRLPTCEPFNSTAAPVALGAMCAKALAMRGCPAKLKWPNDLILPAGPKLAKVGGILLEDHDGVLIGGIGINIVGAPAHMREPWSLPATSLQISCGGQWPSSRELWPLLVKSMLTVYKDADFFASHWLQLTESLMLFIGLPVEVGDNGEIIAGTLRGIAKDGCARLETSSGMVNVCSGSLRLD